MSHWDPSKLTHFNTGILTRKARVILVKITVEMCPFTRIPMTCLNVLFMLQNFSQCSLTVLSLVPLSSEVYRIQRFKWYQSTYEKKGKFMNDLCFKPKLTCKLYSLFLRSLKTETTVLYRILMLKWVAFKDICNCNWNQWFHVDPMIPHGSMIDYQPTVEMNSTVRSLTAKDFPANAPRAGNI